MDIKMNRQSAAKFELVFKPFPIDLGGYEKNYQYLFCFYVSFEWLGEKRIFFKWGYLNIYSFIFPPKTCISSLGRSNIYIAEQTST